MSAGVEGKTPLRQQSSDNNSVSSNEWDMASEVFFTEFSDAPLTDGVSARDSALPGLYHSMDHGLVHGLEGHLPLMREETPRLDSQMAQDVMMLGLSADDYSNPPYLDHDLNIDLEYTESDGNVKKRLRSNSSRHRGEIVTELGPEEVRWFYRDDKRTWKPFVGHDSLKIELVFRRFCEQTSHNVRQSVGATEPEHQTLQAYSGVCGGVEDSSPEVVCVRGGLYEVDIRDKECYPVYWNQQDRIPVMRGQWFIDGTWQPLEEDDSNQIEQVHLRWFRGQRIDTYETESASTVVDSKDDNTSAVAVL